MEKTTLITSTHGKLLEMEREQKEPVGSIWSLGGTKAINGLWAAASDDTVGLDALLVD
jgi:hypothetical protein